MFRAEGKWGETLRGLKNLRFAESSMLAMVADKEMVNLHTLKAKLRQPAQPHAAGEKLGLEAQLSKREITVENGDRGPARRLTADEAADLHLYHMREDADYRALWERYVKEKVGRMSQDERNRRGITGSDRAGWKLDAREILNQRLEWRSWLPASGPPLTGEQGGQHVLMHHPFALQVLMPPSHPYLQVKRNSCARIGKCMVTL